MKRRKFVLGLGIAAAVGGTAIGSGAFSSVEASRDVDVEVSGDANAYLRIESTGTPNGEYARGASDGAMYLDFTGESSQIDGSGLNQEGVTGLSRVFQIENRGTQEVAVTIEPGAGTNATAIMPQNISPPDSNQEVLLVITAHNTNPQAPVNLSPGESQEFSITATVSSDLNGASAIEQDRFTIKAEAN